MEIKTIIKELETLRPRHDYYDILDDWFSVMALSIVQAVSSRDKFWLSREKKFLEIAKKYSGSEFKIFKDCFAMLVTLIDEDVKRGNFKDWLGEIYMLSNTWSKKSGQCFTPISVGKVLAELLISQNKFISDCSEIITLNDPCVGSGSLPIAYCEKLHNEGINYQKRLYVEANDIDERCFHMAYIQLSLLGVCGKIQWKDTRSQKLYDEWETPFLVLKRLNSIELLFREMEMDNAKKIFSLGK